MVLWFHFATILPDPGHDARRRNAADAVAAQENALGSAVNESGRVEAFSDGVFAIAITLLVLEIRVPDVGSGSLWTALGAEWPSYLAYVIGFLVIGIMWINHHSVFTVIAKVDRPLLFLNLLLLLVVAALPWPTGVVAHYLLTPHASVAVALFSCFMVAHALTFQLFWWYATRSGHLFHEHIDVAGARRTRLRFAFGSLAYPVTVGLAFVSPLLTLALHGALAVYYAFNQVPVPTRADAES